MRALFGIAGFRQRLLIAVGALPVVTACGGKVVFVEEDDGSGGSPNNNGGAPSIPSSGGAAGEAPMGGAPGFCPNPEGVYVCVQTFEGCPAASSPEAAVLIEQKVEADQSCTNDPEFCWCDATVLDVPCGPDPDALECCYYANVPVVEMCEGRPFFVSDELRVAPVSAREDWARELAPDLASLAAADREALARVWQRRAQLEHASVASFARFMLELLAVAAPPALVASAASAANDEIEHARACFGLASAFAGRPVGPGPLAIEGALDGRKGLAEIAAAAVVEGCIGETCAALEATLAYEASSCPVVTAATRAIAADEQEHAALAWRFVSWALANGDEGVRASITRAFRQLPPLEVEASELDAETGRRFGVLTPDEQREIRERAWREVIAPARDSLLASRPSSQAALREAAI